MSTRFFYGIGFIFISLLLTVSIYLQVVDGIMPCPLCTLQRFTFGLLGGLFLFGFFLGSRPVTRLMIPFSLVLFSLLGIFLAGRQIWLQHYGTANNECGVPLQYLLQALPFDQVMQKVFEGSAECVQRGWEFLHLNMAEWALLSFIFFFFLSLVLMLKRTRG